MLSIQHPKLLLLIDLAAGSGGRFRADEAANLCLEADQGEVE